MKIEKYKYLGAGKYKIFIDNCEYIIYEDIIIKYNILGKNEISSEDLKRWLKDNDFYEAYYKTIKLINTKMRTPKEIENLLKKNDYEIKIINLVIDRLKNEGYLNDEIYTKAYIYDSINLKTVGPLKIKQELLQKGINEHIIDENMKQFTYDIQVEKIDKLIKKEIKLNVNKSSYILKNKILISLINKGFEKNIINDILNNYDIDDKNIYEKEYKKVYDKLSKKYTGKELEYKVKEKMYQKGFRD